MTSIQHNASLRQARSVDVWWSAPLSNLAATWRNWFSDRLKKIKPAIKTSRKVLNGPYVHNKLSYVFFSRFFVGHPSYLPWQVTGHANVTVMMATLTYWVLKATYAYFTWFFHYISNLLIQATALIKLKHLIVSISGASLTDNWQITDSTIVSSAGICSIILPATC